MEALQQIGFLWIHEISHILREHNQRAAEGAVDPKIWNIAADMEINDSHWDGLEAPVLYPGIYPNTFKMNSGELAETYYKKLTEKSEEDIKKGLAKAMDKILADEAKEKEENKEKEDSQEEPSSETDNPSEDGEPEDGDQGDPEDSSESKEGKDEKEGEGSNSAEKEGTDPNDSKNDSDPKNQEEDQNKSNEEEENPTPDSANKNTNPTESDKNKAENNQASEPSDSEEKAGADQYEDPNAPYHELLDEGSGVHNVPRPWELDSTDIAPQELDDIETEQIRISVAKEMSEAQKAGLLPLGWERWVGRKLRPVVDWKKVLRHRVSRAINHSVGARIDYSFARPSRRQSVYQPLIPPALSGNLTGQIACVVDTSGSIDDVQLNRILSEVCGILEVFNTPVTIIPCDAKAYPPILLTRSTNLKEITSMPGGGGTNMIRGIEAALELKIKPDVVVVLTDGYTRYPEKLYKTPVLFGIITNDLERTNMLPGPPWRDDLVVKILID